MSGQGEGYDGFKSSEAGPSRFGRRSSADMPDFQRRHERIEEQDSMEVDSVESDNQLGLNGHRKAIDLGSDDEDMGHLTRNTEAMHLRDHEDREDALASARERERERSRDRDPDSTPTRPPYLTPQTHLLRPNLPSPNTSPTQNRPRLPAPLSRRHGPSTSMSSNSSAGSSRPNIAPLDLPSSASEIFGSMRPPPLLRQATYSSLPPSPTLDHEERLRGAGAIGGLGIKEMEDILSSLSHGHTPIHASTPLPLPNPGGAGNEEEEWHPARSRRSTLGENDFEESMDSPVDFRGNAHGHPPEGGETSGSGDGGSEEEAERRRRDKFRSTSPGAFESLGDLRKSKSSLWEILQDESGAEDWEAWVVDGKWERIANFLAIPVAIERVTLFGALLCLDGFLYNFTILPIRATFAFLRFVRRRLSFQSIYPIPPTHISSLIRLLLLVIPSAVLLVSTDTSKMYHSVRGQDTIKLYVIFNALEIADRLCGAFGQDVLDTLFARDTLSPLSNHRHTSRKREKARPYFFFALSLGYVLAHTLIFFYMLVSLNVAINSYDYTLLSLLISNQFVEIKGSVFKKFEKENLFQILCADIVERFQLSLMLAVIAMRNMIEMAGSDLAFLPKSFIKGKNLFDSIASPLLFVIVSEMLVDWLKHAFITKFNHVRVSVYGRFADVLAKDVMLAGSFGSASQNAKTRTHPLLLDQSPLVARRLGFASIPLACLVIRISAQAIGMLTGSHHEDGTKLSIGDMAWILVKWTGLIGLGICAWVCLVALKVLLGLSLLSYSTIRESGMDEREAEDAVNDFGRTAMAESKEQTEYNKRTAKYLSSRFDDMTEFASPSMSLSPSADYRFNVSTENGVRRLDTPDLDDLASPNGAGERRNVAPGKRKKWKLEEVERWTMVKRIW